MPKLFVAICLFLTGCSSQVHLITQGYDNEQTAEISAKISKAGFTVVQSSIGIPSHYPNSVIALNPAHSVEQDIPNLQQLVHELGFNSAEVLRFGSDKHFYNNGHIGLYLRHPSINPNSLMPPYIESIQCPTGYATLGFGGNQKMHLETGKNVNGELELSTVHGHWAFNGNLLTLSLPQLNKARFIQTEVNRETHLGARPALLYTPQQANHSIAALNCSFEVILMN